MKIRLTCAGDVDDVLGIFRNGRRIMRSVGNFSQWPEGYPAREHILRDIELSQGYVMEQEGKIVATFVLQLGEEPTYLEIFGGRWTSSADYGTIHRIAKAEDAPAGVFGACLDFCKGKVGYIRIDTHEDNIIMGKLLEKYGFVRCGTIFLKDGSPRNAYDKLVEDGK